MGTFITKGCEQGTQLAAILTENHTKVSLTQCSALNLGEMPVDILDQVILCHCESKGKAFNCVSSLNSLGTISTPHCSDNNQNKQANNAATSLDFRKSPLKGNIVSSGTILTKSEFLIDKASRYYTSHRPVSPLYRLNLVS